MISRVLEWYFSAIVTSTFKVSTAGCLSQSVFSRFPGCKDLSNTFPIIFT